MEKLNVLLASLKELVSYDSSLKKESAVLVRLLKQLHKDARAFKKFQTLIGPFVLKAQQAQAMGLFPSNVFLRFYGSLLEFDNECVVIANLAGNA